MCLFVFLRSKMAGVQVRNRASDKQSAILSVLLLCSHLAASGKCQLLPPDNVRTACQQTETDHSWGFELGPLGHINGDTTTTTHWSAVCAVLLFIVSGVRSQCRRGMNFGIRNPCAICVCECLCVLRSICYHKSVPRPERIAKARDFLATIPIIINNNAASSAFSVSRSQILDGLTCILQSLVRYGVDIDKASSSSSTTFSMCSVNIQTRDLRVADA